MMTRRMRVVVSIGGLLVMVGAFWWMRGRGGPEGEGGAPASVRARGTVTVRAKSRGVTGGVWRQLDVDARRVAGVVTYRGAPVAGATVRLELDVQLRGAIPMEELTTGADGTFDFGPRAAAESRVSASAEGHAPAAVFIDLRDPTLTPPPDRLELALGGCDRTAEGTVHDAGGPIAGATVRAGSREGLAVTTTDPSGAYRLCINQGRVAMAALADGYARAAGWAEGGRRVRRDFELVPEVVLAGVVLGEGDRPVAGALVSAKLAGDTLFRGVGSSNATSGDDGRFTIGGVAPGRHVLSARGTGQATAEPVDVVARVGEPVDDAVLRLQPVVIVRGRVLEGDRRVAGAHVSVKPGLGDMFGDIDARMTTGRIDAITQADGSFTLDGVLPGPFEIEIRDHEVIEPTTAVAALPETDLTVKVAAEASINGRVTRRGAPVAGASVGAHGEGRFPESLLSGGSAETRADGTFSILGLQPGTYQVGARSETAVASQVPVTVAKGQRLEGIAIELDRDLAGEVSGTVVDQRGDPVSGAYVELELGAGGSSRGALTEEDGSFVAGNMSGGGDYSVTVRPSRNSKVSFSPAGGHVFAPIAVPNGLSRITGVRIAIQVDRHPVTGIVVHQSGKPAADVTVSALSSGEDDRGSDPESSATTGADGRFTLRDLIGGSYVIRAKTGTGIETEAKDVPAGRRGLRLRLPGAGSIEGTITGFGGNVRVTATSLDRKRFDSYRGVVEHGRFRIRELPVGTYGVSAREGDAVDGVDVTVEAGKTATARLASDGLATVNGRVIDATTRTPLANLQCRAMIGYGAMVATTAGDGRFRLTIPARRDVSVGCHSPDLSLGNWGSTDVVRLEPGTTGEVLVEVTRRSTEEPPVDFGLSLEDSKPAK